MKSIKSSILAEYIFKAGHMLTLEELIVDTHDDYDPWASVSVGFGDDRSFIVELDTSDDSPDEFFSGQGGSGHIVHAVIGYEDAVSLSRRLGVRLTELPAAIAGRFSGDLDRHTSTYVEGVFHDILGFIEGSGIRYRMKRTPKGNS